MALRPLSRVLSRAASSPLSASRRQNPQLSLRWLSSASRPPMVVLAHHRPTLQRHHQPVTQGRTGVPSDRRTIFIETDTTPNADVSVHAPLYTDASCATRNFDLNPFFVYTRLSSSGLTTLFFLKAFRFPSLNT